MSKDNLPPKETPDQKLERLEAQYMELSKAMAEQNTKLDASAAILQKVVAFLQQQPAPGQTAAAAPAGQAPPAGQPAQKFDISSLGPLIEAGEKIITMIISAKNGMAPGQTVKSDPVEELMLKRLHKNYMKNLVIKESLSEREIQSLMKSGKLSKETQDLLKEIESQA